MNANRRFVRALKQALAAVERGDTGCASSPEKCWWCAMRYRTGAFGKEGRFQLIGSTSNGPAVNWSLDHPKSDTVALFRNSIAAMEQQA